MRQRAAHHQTLGYHTGRTSIMTSRGTRGIAARLPRRPRSFGTVGFCGACASFVFFLGGIGLDKRREERDDRSR